MIERHGRGSQEVVRQQESLPIEDADQAELVAFFREGYGEAYKGDERFFKKIDRASHVVVLRDSDRGIAAAALIEGRRILSPSTSPDRERFGGRQSNMIKLLRACFEQVGAQWITIGEQYDRMQATATEAGMLRADSEELVRGLLHEANSDGDYKVQGDEDGRLVVMKATSETRPDYKQQVWVYIPEDDLETFR